MINMIFNRKSKKVGKAVIIKPDSDTIGADYNELKGAIIGIINTQDNEDVYIVRLNNAPIIDGDFTVTDILLGGIGMNLGDELFGKPKHSVQVIGTRHGEKLYEALLSREEMVSAEDMGEYYRIPPDLRDLNYSKFIEQG